MRVHFTVTSPFVRFFNCSLQNLFNLNWLIFRLCLWVGFEYRFGNLWLRNFRNFDIKVFRFFIIGLFSHQGPTFLLLVIFIWFVCSACGLRLWIRIRQVLHWHFNLFLSIRSVCARIFARIVKTNCHRLCQCVWVRSRVFDWPHSHPTCFLFWSDFCLPFGLWLCVLVLVILHFRFLFFLLISYTLTSCCTVMESSDFTEPMYNVCVHLDHNS